MEYPVYITAMWNKNRRINGKQWGLLQEYKNNKHKDATSHELPEKKPGKQKSKKTAPRKAVRLGISCGREGISPEWKFR